MGSNSKHCGRQDTSGNSSRILAVEDDPVFRQLLHPILQGAGYRIDFAASVTQAIEQLDKQYFDLALLDIQLPDGSGISIASQLFNKYHVPFLFLTVSTDEAFIKEATSLFALGYILKPIQPAQFLITVKTALANARNVENLQIAIGVHESVGIAVGLMMSLGQYSRHACLTQIQRFACDNNYSMHAICEFIVGLFDQLSAVKNSQQRPRNVEDIFDAYKHHRRH